MGARQDEPGFFWPPVTDVAVTDSPAPLNARCRCVPRRGLAEQDDPTDTSTVLLNTFTPDLYVEYFRDLRDMIADGQPLTAETTIAAMSRYATEPATDFA